MLSDRERATLDEIQDQLQTEDPRFVRAFDAPAHRRIGLPGEAVLRRGRQVLPWCTVALAVLVLMAGSVGGAALLAMLGLAFWMARR